MTNFSSIDSTHIEVTQGIEGWKVAIYLSHDVLRQVVESGRAEVTDDIEEISLDLHHDAPLNPGLQPVARLRINI